MGEGLLFKMSVFNRRLYKQSHTPTVDDVGPPPPLEFLISCSISKRFWLQWKAFDLIYNIIIIINLYSGSLLHLRVLQKVLDETK